MYGRGISDSTYKHRYKGKFRDSLRNVADVYIESLCREYEQSDPTQPSSGERDKDWNSCIALQTAGQLLGHLCGWSIDHEIGKAALGLEWLPVSQVQGVSSKAKAEFEKQVAISRSDEPEKRGGLVRENGVDSKSYPVEVQRQMLINVLERLDGGLHFSLVGELIKALEALSLGQVLPLLKPEKRGRAWTRAHCQLEALEYVEFWHSYKQIPRATYQMHVWMAFDHKPDPHGFREEAEEDRTRSVRRWKKQAINQLGLLRVEQQLASARNGGKNIRRGKLPKRAVKMNESIYSRERLKQIGRRFRDNDPSAIAQ